MYTRATNADACTECCKRHRHYFVDELNGKRKMKTLSFSNMCFHIVWWFRMKLPGQMFCQNVRSTTIFVLDAWHLDQVSIEAIREIKSFSEIFARSSLLLSFHRYLMQFHGKLRLFLSSGTYNNFVISISSRDFQFEFDC